MKKCAAVIAGLALVSASAASVGESAMTATGAETPIHTESPLAALNADDIEGKDVVDTAGHELGDINEVVKDQSNQMMVVIGLKDSAKEVAIPLDKLSMTSDTDTLSSSMSREQLQALPDYDPRDMESGEE